MRLIPVIDLKDGGVVHAVAGQREAYKPIESVLVNTAEPLAVLQALRDTLNCDEFYVADLNAIQGRGDHKDVIASLAQEPGVRLLVDAGVTCADDAWQLVALGVARVVVGAETLPGWAVLQDILAAIPAARLVFSLDMRDRRVLSRAPELAQLSPLEALARLKQLGLAEVASARSPVAMACVGLKPAASACEIILLDLARVGTGRGPDLPLLAGARRAHPDLTLLAGGGVRNLADLRALQALGIDGVLVATALHRGQITPDELRQLGP